MGRRFATGSLVGLLLLAGCASAEFDRGQAVADVALTWGVDRPVAVCMVDALVDRFGEDELADAREPTDAEVELLIAAVPACETREQWINLIAQTSGTRATAACIFDTATDEFGAEVVTGGDATDAQTARLAEITEVCSQEE